MARFEKFGDYMFSLLFTPLRKVKQSANQFYIFCKVVGKLFDDCKNDIFTVRAESMVISASESMLPEHGKDRTMVRLLNEDVETYRIRLCMKAIVSQMAGTNQGVLLAVKSLGYTDSSVVPYRTIDPDRWAEFIVMINIGIDQENVEYSTLRNEVRAVKEAIAKDNYHFTLNSDTRGIGEETTVMTVACQTSISFWTGKRLLDGSSLLDGSVSLDQELVNYPIIITCHSNPEQVININ